MKLKKPKIEIKRIFIIAGLVVFALLMMDLNSRLWDLTRLTTERDKAQTKVFEQYATQAVLKTKLAYANSEGAVEEWARSEAGWAKPGDQVIIPLAEDERIITPTAVPTPTIQPVKNWEVWRALFFDQ